MNNNKGSKQRTENNRLKEKRNICINRVLNSGPLQRQIFSGTANCYNFTSELLVFCAYSYVNT